MRWTEHHRPYINNVSTSYHINRRDIYIALLKIEVKAFVKIESYLVC